MKNLIPLFLLSIFLLGTVGSDAQLNEEVWLITGNKMLGKGFKKWRFDGSFDGRNSFSDGETVRVAGLRMGVEYKRIHRFGIGFYDLAAPVNQKIYQTPDTLFSPASLTLSYRSFYYERVLYFDPKWEFSGTAHLAQGDIIVSNTDQFTGLFTEYERLEVTPIELSASGYHHLTWWLSAGLGVGYRWMLNTPEEIAPLYSSTVYLAKVKLRIGKVMRSLWDKEAKYEY